MRGNYVGIGFPSISKLPLSFLICFWESLLMVFQLPSFRSTVCAVVAFAVFFLNQDHFEPLERFAERLRGGEEEEDPVSVSEAKKMQKREVKLKRYLSWSQQ